MLVLCIVSRIRIVNGLIDVGAELDNLTCDLFKAGFTPLPNLVLADYVAQVCDFSNYAAQTPVVWNGAYLDANNTAYVLGGLMEFPAAFASPFVPNSVGGYYLHTGGLLRGGEMFMDANGTPTPQAILNQYNVCSVIPRFGFSQ